MTSPAEDIARRQACALARDALKDEEGYTQHPVADAHDTMVVGYGHNLMREGINRSQADWLLADVVRQRYAELAVYDWFQGLTPGRQAAIVEMSYQLGVMGVLGFKRMIAAIERGDVDVAAVEMWDSTWAQQTPARAKRVMKRFQMGSS